MRQKCFLLKVATVSVGVAVTTVACGTSMVGSVFVPQTDAASDAPGNEEFMASSGETPARMRQTSARWARCLSILAKTGR